MVATILAAVSAIVMVVILGSVLGAVHRRERLLFVPGIVLLAIGPVVAGAVPGTAALGALVALTGGAAVAGSTIPLLRESARTG